MDFISIKQRIKKHTPHTPKGQVPGCQRGFIHGAAWFGQEVPSGNVSPEGGGLWLLLQ